VQAVGSIGVVLGEGLAMDGDTAHELNEFGNFPWEQLDDTWFRHGGVGRGGIIAGIDFNRPHHRPTIQFVREDLSADVWEIPPQMLRLLNSYYENGADDLRGKLRGLLEVPRL
jgi:hypothetical protein